MHQFKKGDAVRIVRGKYMGRNALVQHANPETVYCSLVLLAGVKVIGANARPVDLLKLGVPKCETPSKPGTPNEGGTQCYG